MNGGRLPARILVHTATPVSYEEPQTSPAEWIEGEPGATGGGQAVTGEPFACVLFMPAPGGQQQTPAGGRSRVVTVPTVLYNPTRQVHRPGLVADGSAIVIGPEDELRIDAPELQSIVGVNPGRWLMQGDPQPFGPPGQVIGMQAQVEMVRD